MTTPFIVLISVAGGAIIGFVVSMFFPRHDPVIRDMFRDLEHDNFRLGQDMDLSMHQHVSTASFHREVLTLLSAGETDEAIVQLRDWLSDFYAQWSSGDGDGLPHEDEARAELRALVDAADHIPVFESIVGKR